MPSIGDCFWYKHPCSPKSHLCIIIHIAEGFSPDGTDRYIVANVSNVKTDDCCLLTINDHSSLTPLGSYVRFDKLDALDRKTVEHEMKVNRANPPRVSKKVVDRIRASAHISKHTPIKYTRVIPNPIEVLIPTQRPEQPSVMLDKKVSIR